MPYDWPRDVEASSVRLYNTLPTTHTHSLRSGGRSDTTVTGILKMVHSYGTNTSYSHSVKS
jgi:hypothetical protein